MNWIYELAGHAAGQFAGLNQEERDGLLDELDKVVQDHNLGRVPRHGKTEKMKGREGVFRLKSWPRRALFRIVRRVVFDDQSKPIMEGDGKNRKPVEEGVIEVFEIELRDKVYKKK